MGGAEVVVTAGIKGLGVWASELNGHVQSVDAALSTLSVREFDGYSLLIQKSGKGFQLALEGFYDKFETVNCYYQKAVGQVSDDCSGSTPPLLQQKQHPLLLKV
eukprot:TRINITY_DN279_c0_g1_i3.p1 TRINITY_DN279_c0_g1~~TRINITY_DN279_c0_g1_i3.p1  ORF type:complete len:104 (-),score=23.02 TRINITY_DN279_c0_g1_i3:55-366(-)